MTIGTTNAVAKIAALVAGLGLVAMSFAAFAPAAQAATQAEIQAQIAALQAQLNAAQVGTTFTSDLTVGSTGPQVVALQTWLIGKGFSIPAGATGYFGTQTQAAVAAYQTSKGIVPAVGYFGPLTRASVNASVGSGSGTTPDPIFTGDDEGSLDDFDQSSKFNNEEVGEDEEDVSVLGVNFEANDADQSVDRVEVVFAPQGPNDDLEDYITEVAVILDGDVLARADVDEANEDDGEYTFRFSGLDGIVEDGEQGELEIAVSGVSNIDSADIGQNITVTIPEDGVRASSPNGVSETYDSGDFGATFSVEPFAQAAGVELKVSESDSSPEAGTVDVDTDDETNDVGFLELSLEAEGSDINVSELVFTVESDGANVGEIINNLSIRVDGEEYTKNVSTASTTATVVFDDLDIDIEEGQTVDVLVYGDVNELGGNFTEGDTLKVSVTSANADAIEAEDETGEDLVASDITGSANGEEQAFFAEGLTVTFNDGSKELNQVDGADNDSAVFTIDFTVEAGEEDVFISTSTPFTVTGAGGISTSSFLDGDETSTNGNFEVAAGEEEQFTLTVVITNTGAASGFYELKLDGILWNTTDSTVTYNTYDFELDDFKSGVQFLND